MRPCKAVYVMSGVRRDVRFGLEAEVHSRPDADIEHPAIRVMILPLSSTKVALSENLESSINGDFRRTPARTGVSNYALRALAESNCRRVFLVRFGKRLPGLLRSPAALFSPE